MTAADTTKILQEAGLKATPSRAAILTALMQAGKPATISELRTRPAIKALDMVTTYRTLASFEDAGIAKRIDLRKDAAAYEFNGQHHHHIVCTNCGALEDFEFCDIEAVTKRIAKSSKKFGTIRDHSLELFGVCMACEAR